MVYLWELLHREVFRIDILVKVDRPNIGVIDSTPCGSFSDTANYYENCGGAYGGRIPQPC